MKAVEYGKQNSEVIMLLHGGGLSWWSYGAAAALLGAAYHVILPILDGHAGSDRPFTTIEENAAELLSFIDEQCGGSVLLLGGLSLGAQIAAESLSRRGDICRYAVLESASVLPSKLVNSLMAPTLRSCYGLVQKRWFARAQFRSLHIREELFEAYYRDTARISRTDMIAFLRASTAYEVKPALRSCRARARIIVGGREQRSMLRSARLLHDMLPGSVLDIRAGLRHGEYSLNHPAQFAEELERMLAG